jgi:hypothetical protein
MNSGPARLLLLDQTERGGQAAVNATLARYGFD